MLDLERNSIESERNSIESYSRTRSESYGGRRAMRTPLAPRQNRLLAALPVEDYERLLPMLELVPLPLGWAVHGPGDREKYLYFVASGIVCRFHVTQDGLSTAFALTGNEGLIGVALFLGGVSTPSQSVVLGAGYAYRIRADLLKTEFESDGALPHLLLRYTHALVTQIGQAAACNRHHTLEQRLRRWLLACLDRMPANELTMPQDLIGDMLGVRRESVTDAAGRLQAAGLISYRRGKISILDRQALEAGVCECYAVVKRAFDRLLLPEDTAANTRAYCGFANLALSRA
jgi:CRP-like cAMP-binding protein